jgi:hypothetical protein
MVPDENLHRLGSDFGEIAERTANTAPGQLSVILLIRFCIKLGSSKEPPKGPALITLS